MKKVFKGIILLALSLSMVSCSSSNNSDNEKKSVEAKNEKKDHPELEGEVKVIRWVRGHSGNAMMSLAKRNGYLDEYGIKVEEIPMQTTNDSFAALKAGQVDIISNAGTATPLQYIAKKEDVSIFGGHMVEGAVKLVARADTKWNGLEDLIGKKVAGRPGNYQFTGVLLEKGYDPKTQIEWINLNAADGLAAVVSGEADYCVLGTEFVLKLQNMDSVKIVADSGEVMPRYSCCRMETSKTFIEKNPNTVKALLKALIRGQRDFEKDKETATKVLAEELDAPVDFVKAYMTDDGYEIHPDPLYNSIVRAWGYLDKLGLLDEEAKKINLKEYVNIDIYKKALDEVISEVGDQDPEYWNAMKKYFEDNNSKYFE